MTKAKDPSKRDWFDEFMKSDPLSKKLYFPHNDFVIESPMMHPDTYKELYETIHNAKDGEKDE